MHGNTDNKYLLQIVSLFQNKLFKEALDLSKKKELSNSIIQKNPEFHNIIGLINLELKDWNSAIINFNNSIDLDKKFRPAHFNLGIVYYDTGEFKKSYSKFLDVISIEKDNKRAQENMIKILDFEAIKNQDKFSFINSELQKIKINLNFYKEIDNNKIINLYKLSNQIVSKLMRDLSFREHQLFVHNKGDLNCERHFRIFNTHKIIPKNCFGCLKIIIHLYNVVDLIKLSLIFKNFELLKNNEMKCRIDFDQKFYRGYIYCNSIEELNFIKDKLQEIINIQFKKNYKIETRRGCSEFSKLFNKFKNIDDKLDKMFSYPNEWMQKEVLYDNTNYKNGLVKLRNVKKPLKGITLNNFLIINNWVNYAKSIGDLSFSNNFKT